jgi:hypothetical protein
MSVMFHGIDSVKLEAVLATGVDEDGNPIVPFADEDGGWPLRCCLQESAAGDRLAIIAWSPFDWTGPYRETGPVVVHVEACPGTPDVLSRLPAELDARPMVLRPYSHDHRILYELVTHLPVGGGVGAHAARLLRNPDVAEVHGRNWTGGCYAFTARRFDDRPGATTGKAS